MPGSHGYVCGERDTQTTKTMTLARAMAVEALGGKMEEGGVLMIKMKMQRLLRFGGRLGSRLWASRALLPRSLLRLLLPPVHPPPWRRPCMTRTLPSPLRVLLLLPGCSLPMMPRQRLPLRLLPLPEGAAARLT